MININEGRNDKIVKGCKELHEYSMFVAQARNFLLTLGNQEEAIKEAVIYCQKHGILKQFLEIHGSEVLNMLLTEWNIDDAKVVWQEEAREEAREERNRAIVMNLLAEGASPEFIRKITGLDLETIQKISEQVTSNRAAG